MSRPILPFETRHRALEFLVATAEAQAIWRDARNYARAILRAGSRPGYAGSSEARWHLIHLGEMLEELEEWERERYEPWEPYFNEADHVAAQSGGRG